MSALAEDDCEQRAKASGEALQQAKARELFDLIGGSELIGEGRVHVISIDPIKIGLGRRWEAKAEQTLEHVQRHFRKHLSPSDLWLQISETEFLISSPDTPAVVAQGVCYRSLKEILSHFLGQFDPADVVVKQVVDLQPDRIQCSAISPADLQRAGSQAEAIRSPPSAPELNSALNELKSWPLRTVDSQEVTVSFAVDPVINLKAMALAGHRLEARLLSATGEELTGHQRKSLLACDFGRVDLAALERAMSRLSHEEHGEKPWLILQLSFAGLTNGRVRSALLAKARDLLQVMQRAVICELVDVDSGVPEGRLAEIATLVRPLCRAVFAQVEPSGRTIEAVQAAHMAGLTVRANELGGDSQAIVRELRRFARAAKGAAPVLTITNLPHPHLLVHARDAGFSHATLRVHPAGLHS